MIGGTFMIMDFVSMLNLFVCLRGQTMRLTPTFIIEPLFCPLDMERSKKLKTEFSELFGKIGTLKNDVLQYKTCGLGQSDGKCRWQITYRKSCSFAEIIRSFVQALAKMPGIW